MNCPNCNSPKVIGYNPFNFKSLISLVDNEWILQDPQVSYIYYHSKHRYFYRCSNCFSEIKKESNSPIQKKFSPAINHNEIVLDLDGTLFYHNHFDQRKIEWDLSIICPTTKFTIRQKARPFLKEFITFCINHFDKINIFTASEDWYAEHLISYLEIPKNKIGYIKTRKDTVLKRPISFEREFVKEINNSFVIEDKPLVIEGHNNTVYHIKEYWGDDRDRELKKLIKFIQNKKRKVINFNKKIDINFKLFLKKIQIKTKKVPFSLIKEIEASITSITHEEMIKGGVFTNLNSFPYFISDYNGFQYQFSDLNYENYIRLINIIKSYIHQHKVLSENEFYDLLSKDEIDNDF